MSAEKVKIVLVDDFEMNHQLFNAWFRRDQQAKNIERFTATNLDEAEAILAGFESRIKLVLLLDENLGEVKSTPLVSKVKELVGGILEDVLIISVSALPKELDGLVHIKKSDAKGFESLIPAVLAFVTGNVEAAQAAFYLAEQK